MFFVSGLRSSERYTVNTRFMYCFVNCAFQYVMFPSTTSTNAAWWPGYCRAVYARSRMPAPQKRRLPWLRCPSHIPRKWSRVPVEPFGEHRHQRVVTRAAATDDDFIREGGQKCSVSVLNRASG